MNLRVKRLMKMSVGTSLEVHYGNGQIFSGKISDKDDECIAISNGRQEIVIDYDDIELYIEGEDVTKPVVQGQSKINKQDMSINKNTSNKCIIPSFDVTIEKIGVPDNDVKGAFSELDSSSKKKLNNRYDRFIMRCEQWIGSEQNKEF